MAQTTMLPDSVYSELARLMREQIDARKVDRFLQLDLELRVSLEKRLARPQSEYTPAKYYRLEDVIDMVRHKPIALVAAPGAGKTTLSAEILAKLYNDNNRIPIFVPLARLRRDNTIEELVASLLPPLTEVLDVLQNCECAIAFDGLNEAAGVDVDDALERLVAFQGSFPKHYYVVSCRDAEFPGWAQEQFSEIHLLPLSRETVEQHLAEALGARYFAEMAQQMKEAGRWDDYIELCRTPLFLMMVLSLLGTKVSAPNVLLSSRAEVYDIFLAQLLEREGSKRAKDRNDTSISSALRIALLSYLGFVMQGKTLVSVDESEAEELLLTWIGEPSNAKYTAGLSGNKLSILVNNVLRRPPIVAERGAKNIPRTVYFFAHQTFGEYFSAKFIARLLQSEGMGSSQVADILQRSGRRHWEVFAFVAGIMDTATELVRHIARKAVREGKQELLLLAARMLREIRSVTEIDTRDMQIRLMEAFKNGPRPFDYEIIHALRDLGTLKAFSEEWGRQEDIERFVKKYAEYRPFEYRYAAHEQLFALSVSDSPSEQVAALYTLGLRVAETPELRKTVAEFAVSNFSMTWGHAREQMMALLKDLQWAPAAELLKVAALSPTETPRVRVYALNALAMLGDLNLADTVIDYFRDTSNPYRDSASWSLQILARKAEPTQPALFQQIKELLWRCIIEEENTGENRYTKGTSLYSLGMLHATEYGDRIMAWAENISDAYILEDAILALGLMPAHNATEFVTGFLSHWDPVLRFKAAEALQTLGGSSTIPQLEALRNDRYPVVREMAEWSGMQLKSRL